jgi:hypothetical protein
VFYLIYFSKSFLYFFFIYLKSFFIRKKSFFYIILGDGRKAVARLGHSRRSSEGETAGQSGNKLEEWDWYGDLSLLKFFS